jgi:hypothetical protein
MCQDGAVSVGCCNDVLEQRIKGAVFGFPITTTLSKMLIVTLGDKSRRVVMELKEITATKKKLIEFVESFKVFLGRSERVHWCSMYLSGLLLDGERKSKQPMAQRLPGGNEQALQQFVNQSPWHYDLIQLNLAKYMNNHFQAKTGVLVLDDSSLPKKKIIL